jgi:chemotaxis protein CheD
MRFEGDPKSAPGSGGDLPAIHVLPGQLDASIQPRRFTTVLGSCIAVCLWCPRLRAGGMNHFVLPNRAGEEFGAKFGNVAIPQLIGRMGDLGCRTSDLHAKLFGGASMLSRAKAAGETVGDKNAKLALDMLRVAGIPVVAHDLGGQRGRKVEFHSADGTAWVKLL